MEGLSNQPYLATKNVHELLNFFSSWNTLLYNHNITKFYQISHSMEQIRVQSQINRASEVFCALNTKIFTQKGVDKAICVPRYNLFRKIAPNPDQKQST